MVATKVKVPDKGISSFMGNTGKLSEAEGEHKDCTHQPEFSEPFHRPLDFITPEACPPHQSSWTNKEASFHRKTGGVIQSSVCTIL